MAYTTGFKNQFAIEFSRYPEDQQDKILDFTDLFEQHGLGDFKKYPGKVTPSWKGLLLNDPLYGYAKDNHLWHYHVGLPTYTKSQYGEYLTSDWVLHFQWLNRGNHIDLVDVCYHYRFDGSFHLPPVANLA